MNNTEKLNEFLHKFHHGNIIYPDSVARYSGIPVREVYQIMDEKIKESNPYEDVQYERIYMYQCPRCLHTMPQAYTAIADIPQDEELCCETCDLEFVPKIDNYKVCYRKKG